MPSSEVWNWNSEAGLLSPAQGQQDARAGKSTSSTRWGVIRGLNLVEKAHLSFLRLFMEAPRTIWEPNNSSVIH